MGSLHKAGIAVFSFFLLVPLAQVKADGSADIYAWGTKDCTGSAALYQFRTPGSGVVLQTVSTFASAKLTAAVNVNSVLACQRGYACNGVGANQLQLLGHLNQCVTGNSGTQFDKIQVIVN